jgi:hypothetical protein
MSNREWQEDQCIGERVAAVVEKDRDAASNALRAVMDGRAVDTFAAGMTVRSCIHCGGLVLGGPTACVGCVRAIEARSRLAEVVAAVESRANAALGAHRLGQLAQLKKERSDAMDCAELAERERDEIRKQLDAYRELRPEVRAFAEAMETKLRANDHKGGWQDDAASRLMRRLHEETAELEAALGNSDLKGSAWQALVRREAADVGNFAMMVADVCGSLKAQCPATSSGSAVA